MLNRDIVPAAAFLGRISWKNFTDSFEGSPILALGVTVGFRGSGGLPSLEGSTRCREGKDGKATSADG